MTDRTLLWVFNYEKPRSMKKKKICDRKMFFKKVQSTWFHPNGCVKPGTFCIKENMNLFYVKFTIN